MRGVHRGVITLELVISLGLMATLCAAIMPSITAMVQSVRILSRRVEDSSTSLFIADFLTEKIRNTVEGVEKEARQGNTYDYREEMQADLYPAPAGQPAGDKDSRRIFAAHHRRGR